MKTTLPIVSAHMRSVLLLLEQEGPLSVREINSHLCPSGPVQNRRVFAASMSRTLRRMEGRGLIIRRAEKCEATGVGLFRIHPEQFEAMLDETRKAIRQALEEAFTQYMQSEQGGPEAPNNPT